MSELSFLPPDKFITDSFIIRSYVPGDGACLAEATNASYEHLKTFMPWAQPHQTDEDAENLVRSFRARYLLKEDFILGVFSLDETLQLGGTGFHLREGGLDNHSAEIGMWIRASHAGQGLGTAVLRAMLEWGFSMWPWERLVWRCDSRNVASQRIAEKAGLFQEGVLRAHRRLSDGTRQDTLCYAMLKTEWKKDLNSAYKK